VDTEVGHDASTLRDYLRVVRRRRWVIVQAVVLVPLAAVVLSLQQQHRYQGSAEVLLSQQNLALQLNGAQDPTLLQPADRTAQTQADLARVPTVAKRTSHALRLTDRTPEDLLDASSVTPKQNANLLEIRVTDPKPVLARRLATEYARQFSLYRRELDAAPYKHAFRDVESRLRTLAAHGQRGSGLYANLVESAQELRTREALQTANAYPVKLAGPAAQVQPRPVRNGILGLALGIVVGIGLAFLWEALDTRIRSAEEIIERLRLPLLGRLPAPPRRLSSKNRLAMLEEPNGAQAEAFRVLRTNLEFVNLERGAKTVMITSAVEAEGKSTTAANLAVALARAGKRVALVDLDLRRPFVDRFFALNGHPGITQVALGYSTLDEAMTPFAVLGQENGDGRNGNGHAKVECLVDILRSGTIPPDPGEFVGTQALAGILEQLRERVDVVIIDAPPLLHLGDAITLSARVDAMVLVTRLNVLRRPMVNELHRVLQTCPAAKLGFVLTGADLEEGYGYSGYSRYSSYRRERDRELVA
jgi:polysaccharide biosynthesis transport protein